ncbi:MAG TPA: ParB/RepB/Spo0J family partition protein, partial [Bacillota bacterium]|nr:ParB/RepB/Spo0J family partition protein [Bacillota bacterium]
MKGQKINLLSVHELIPNKNQPRNDFCQEDLENLSRSIKEHGVLQPLIVRKRADIPKCELNGEIIAQQKYEIIAGERRWRASRLAGVKRLPCIILGANDKTSAIIAITENMQREDLSFFEAAYAFKKLIEEYGITQSELAQKLSLSQSTVANKLRLLRFSEEE